MDLKENPQATFRRTRTFRLKDFRSSLVLYFYITAFFLYVYFFSPSSLPPLPPLALFLIKLITLELCIRERVPIQTATPVLRVETAVLFYFRTFGTPGTLRTGRG